ncbi:MAG: hypothetical protein IKB38_10300 [Clostridia bacterium]|nr:hypothetical protein [Clostridia bacterium]
MAIININTSEVVGKIKPMHAVGQAPIMGLGKKHFDSFHYLTEIKAPYSRLHDVRGLFGGGVFVDIPNVFRNFDADENDPASYDFAFTDALINALVEAGVEPYYRLGVTIENQAEIKSYHIDPPKDYGKWARICEHIVAHYIDGWADGFKHKITYWEIWNEPDDSNVLRVSQMWTGTAEDYYRLYDVAAKHLKSVFGDRIKVGGYASCGFYAIVSEWGKSDARCNYYVEFFHGFMKYVRTSGAPLDFFSWHSYDPAQKTHLMAKWVREQLDAYGFTKTESHLNEWNPFSTERGTAHHSAEVEAMMLGMQNLPLDVLVFYDARITGGQYGGLFDPMKYRPWHAYYSLAAFSRLYALENQVKLDCDTEGMFAVAASKGEKTVIVISNISGSDQELKIKGVDLTDARFYVLDQERLLSWAPPVKTVENNAVVMIEI